MLIIHGNLITWTIPNQVLNNHAIFIRNGVIMEIGRTQDLVKKYPGEEYLDANYQYIMPGMICAHTHFYGAFAKGMAIPGDAPKDFLDILSKLWWPLDKSLNREDIYYSALVCLVDAIKHGTTYLFDHHASANTIDGSLDEIAQAVELAGVRASLCYEVTDRDGVDKAKAGIRENIRFYELVKREKPAEGRLSAMFGLHASLTLSQETLAACRDAAPGFMGFHIHAAEHPVDEEDCLKKYRMRVVERLYSLGLLGQGSIVAHAVHVDDHEIGLLAETETWVTHQPRSNMNNAVGIAPVDRMRKAGVKIAMGNDGFSNAMWEEWKTTYLVHKLKNEDPRTMPGNDVIDIAVYQTAAMANQLNSNAQNPIGSIMSGALADLVFVEYYPFTTLTTENLPWHILFGFRESMVTTTIVGGKVLMRDRQLLTLDVGKINYEVQKIVPGIWERYHSQF